MPGDGTGRELTSALGCACVGLPVVLETCLAQATSAPQPLPKPLTTSQPGWHGAQPPARVPRGSGWPQLLWPGREPSDRARPERHTPLGVPAVAGAARGLRPPQPPPEPLCHCPGLARVPARSRGCTTSPRAGQEPPLRAGFTEISPGRAQGAAAPCSSLLEALPMGSDPPAALPPGAAPPGTGTPRGPRTLPSLVPLPRPAAAARLSPFADASALQSSFISAREAPRES